MRNRQIRRSLSLPAQNVNSAGQIYWFGWIGSALAPLFKSPKEQGAAFDAATGHLHQLTKGVTRHNPAVHSSS
jgi:hypothetical protein